MNEHFYEMFINVNGGEYYVYYKSPVEINLEDVPECAMIDGDLINVHLDAVEYIVKITREEYFEHMIR